MTGSVDPSETPPSDRKYPSIRWHLIRATEIRFNVICGRCKKRKEVRLTELGGGFTGPCRCPVPRFHVRDVEVYDVAGPAG